MRRSPLTAALVVLLTLSGCGAGNSAEDDAGGAASEIVVIPTVTETEQPREEGDVPSIDPLAGAPSDCEPVGEDITPQTTLDVDISGGSLQVSQREVPEGAVQLNVSAQGERHDLLVVFADDPDTLPTDAAGGVDASALGNDLVGRLEIFPAGQPCPITLDLPPGEYVLLCNVVPESGEPHVADGEVTTLTVTAAGD